MNAAETKRKKPYERPELRVIEMKEEEVLAVGCKMAVGSPASGGATCISVPCTAQGS